MIVVVGSLAWQTSDPAGPAGRGCDVALAAAARGAKVELVGRVGDDRVGDELLMRLARAGVGHAAVLRDASRPTPTIVAADDEDRDELEPFADETERPLSDTLRTLTTAAAPRLEPADVSLGISYLTAFSVLVVSDDAPADVLGACVEGAAFAGAHLVVLVPDGVAIPPVPPHATVLGAPRVDDRGAFAGIVGRYAAALSSGSSPADAFATAMGEVGAVPGA